MKEILKLLENFFRNSATGNLANWAAAGGTIFLGYIALRSLKRDSIPRLQVRFMSALDGFFHLILVNAGKIPVFLEGINIKGESIEKIVYEIVSIKNYTEKHTTSEPFPLPEAKLPYPLVAGEKVEISLECHDCEGSPKFPEPEEFFGEENFEVVVRFNTKSDGKTKTATDTYHMLN